MMVTHSSAPRRGGVRALGLAGVGLIGFGAIAYAADPVPSAVIERLKGAVTLERGGGAVRLKEGDTLARRDRVRTGGAARALVMFGDGSQLHLGEHTDIVIEDYSPEQGRKSGVLMLDLVKGAARVKVAEPQNAPDRRIGVKTATAQVSRGTDFWSGPLDGATGFIVIQGALEVRNDAGSAHLDRRRAGTLVKGRDSPPDRPRVWSTGTVDQALMTVAFEE